MKAVRLRTEYLRDPIGIDIRQPRLMWNAEGGVKQTAYQIVAGDWDSGKTASASMQAALPLPLRSRQRVVWKNPPLGRKQPPRRVDGGRV